MYIEIGLSSLTLLEVYGYLPNKAANYFFLVAFGLSCLAHFFQGGKSRSWTFMIAFGVGAFGEAVGMLYSIYLAMIAMITINKGQVMLVESYFERIHSAEHSE